MKSSSSSPPIATPDRQLSITRPVIVQSPTQEKVTRSKAEEAEEAAELQLEIDQLLTSLNLEKPSPLTMPAPEQPVLSDKPVHLENVARTLYDYQKTHITAPEKTPETVTEPANVVDRLLTSRLVQMPKYSSFNPFPSRSFNENVAVNGYKLGLYAPDPSNH